MLVPVPVYKQCVLINIYRIYKYERQKKFRGSSHDVQNIFIFILLFNAHIEEYTKKKHKLKVHIEEREEKKNLQNLINRYYYNNDFILCVDIFYLYTYFYSVSYK